jgi:two-component system, sensor histidine kinase PdtaS
MRSYTSIPEKENMLSRQSSESRAGSESHAAFIYQTDEEHRKLLAWFLRQGLERHERVIYIHDVLPAHVITAFLESDVQEAGACLASGQLSILGTGETYISEGVFDPRRMTAVLQKETKLARMDGYSALRVTAEMTWALRGVPGSERLIEYETGLNEIEMHGRCLTLCQYDRRCFPPSILLYVLASHPTIYVGTEVFENTYYKTVPSSERHGTASATLRNCLSSLTACESRSALRISH